MPEFFRRIPPKPLKFEMMKTNDLLLEILGELKKINKTPANSSTIIEYVKDENTIGNNYSKDIDIIEVESTSFIPSTINSNYKFSNNNESKVIENNLPRNIK